MNGERLTPLQAIQAALARSRYRCANCGEPITYSPVAGGAWIHDTTGKNQSPPCTRPELGGTQNGTDTTGTPL